MNLHMLGLLQGRAYRDLHEHLTNGLTPFHLSLTEWKALALIQDGFDTTTQLAHILDVEPPLATRLIKQLADKGYVRKKENTSDRRTTKIITTTKTKITLPLVTVAVGKLLYDLMGGLTKQEVKTYVHVLETIVMNAKKHSLTEPAEFESLKQHLYETTQKGGETQ